MIDRLGTFDNGGDGGRRGRGRRRGVQLGECRARALLLEPSAEAARPGEGGVLELEGGLAIGAGLLVDLCVC